MVWDMISYPIYAFLGLFLLMIGYLYLYQNKLIYMPEIPNVCTREIKNNPKGNRSPDEEGLDFKELRIKAKDGTILYGWFIHQEKPKNATTVVYFQENAGNIGFRIPYVKKLYEILKLNVILVGYRGYGYSQGTPSETGLMQDGQAILNYVFNDLKDEIDTKRVFILGRSLGGAVGIYCLAAFDYPIIGVMVENTFLSISDLVDHLFSYVKCLKGYLLKNFWPTKDRIVKVKAPILFMISEKDELIPQKHMHTLHSLAKESGYKEKHVIGNAHHNDAWMAGGKSYFKIINSFIQKCEKKEFPEEENIDEYKKLLKN